MADFEINGVQYQSGVIGDLKQFHVLRRLAPLLSAFTAAHPQLVAAMQQPEVDGSPRIRMDLVGEAMAPVATIMARMSDEDVEFVLNACMDVTTRKSGAGWVRVRHNDVVNIKDDNKIVVRLKIAWAVISETFGELIPALDFDPVALMSARG